MNTFDRPNSSWATLDNDQPPSHHARRDIIAIGAATGGLSAICELLSGLPPGFDVAILIALDMGSQPASTVLQILCGYSRLPVSYGTHDALVRRGCVVVAPVRHHMRVTRPGVVLLEDEHAFSSRAPSVNRLFESCAATYGQRVIGVVLSGASHDGTAGLARIEVAGGVGVVQNPAQAVDASMPSHAMRVVRPEHCCMLGSMAPLLIGLASGESLSTEISQSQNQALHTSAGMNMFDRIENCLPSVEPYPGRLGGLRPAID